MEVRLGVDLMGGEQPPQAVFEAVLQVSSHLNTACSFVVIAHHSLFSELKKQYASFGKLTSSIEFITTEQVVEMGDSPLLAVRRKKHSSMAIGILLLQKKKIHAFVSSGNTGALMATALLHLPLLPHIKRPALLASLPTEKGQVVVLDVGAHISPKPEHFIDYASLGIAYCQYVLGIRSPRVGLLNIGEEEEKGTKQVKASYQMLQSFFQKKKTPFLGNVEGREVFQGGIDVLLTDGFTGNIFLKTCEGISSFLLEHLRKHALVKEELFWDLNQKFDYSEYPGALLCGVEGLVIKCHGHSDTVALLNGIYGAFELVEKKLIQKLKTRFSKKSKI